MTDILLGPDGDLFIENGQLKLIDSIEVLTRQRLLNKLRTITGTLFTNINYGIDRNLLFKKGTKDFLDQNIQSLIDNTTGVIRLVEFESSVNLNREYVLTFKYEIETGEIVGIRDLGVSSTGDATIASGIWVDGYWDYSGTYEFTEVWGDDEGEYELPPKSLPLIAADPTETGRVTFTETTLGYDVRLDYNGYPYVLGFAVLVPNGSVLQVTGDLSETLSVVSDWIAEPSIADYDNPMQGVFNIEVGTNGEVQQGSVAFLFVLNDFTTNDDVVIIKDFNVQLKYVNNSDTDIDGVLSYNGAYLTYNGSYLTYNP